MKVVLQQCQALSKSCIQEVTQVQLMHQKIVLLWKAVGWLKSVTWHLNFSVNHVVLIFTWEMSDQMAGYQYDSHSNGHN